MEKTPQNCMGEVIFELLSPIKSSKIELKYYLSYTKRKRREGRKNPICRLVLMLSLGHSQRAEVSQR